MDGRFSQLWDFRAKTRPTAHSVAFVSMLKFFFLPQPRRFELWNTKKFSSPDTCVGFQNVDGGLCSSVLRQLLTGPFTWVKDGERKVSVSEKRYGLHSCCHSAKQSHRTCACYWSHPPPHVVILLLYSICPANTSKSFLRVLLIWVSAYVYKTWLLYWLYYIE